MEREPCEAPNSPPLRLKGPIHRAWKPLVRRTNHLNGKGTRSQATTIKPPTTQLLVPTSDSSKACHEVAKRTALVAELPDSGGRHSFPGLALLSLPHLFLSIAAPHSRIDVFSQYHGPSLHLLYMQKQ